MVEDDCLPPFTDFHIFNPEVENSTFRIESGGNATSWKQRCRSAFFKRPIYHGYAYKVCFVYAWQRCSPTRELWGKVGLLKRDK